MTRNTKQFRAVFLAALMVLSVFAGSIAFAGSAAAVDEVSYLQPTEIDEGSVGNQHNVNVSFDGYTADAGDDYINITLPAGSVNDTATDLGIRNATGVEVAANPTVNVNGDQANVSFDLTGSDVTDQIYLNGTLGVDAPADIDSDVSGPVQFDFESSGGTTASVSSDDITINNADASEPGAPEYLEATHYDNDTASDSETPELELAFSEPVTIPNENDVRIYVDEDRIANDQFSIEQNDAGRILISLNKLYTGDMEVYLTSDITDGSQALSNTGNKTVDVAPVPVKGGEDINAYKGSSVAVVAGNTSADVTVEASDDEDYDYFLSGSTGTNSQVYVFNTSNRNTGQYNISIENEQMATVNVRDLGLAVDIDDRTVTNDDEIEGTVEANAGNRPITIELLDSDGDVVDDENATITTTLTGQATRDFTFDLANIDDGELDEGNYTVMATDNQSGVEAESSSIEVSEAGEGRADFGGDGIITEQRGDVANITVTLSNTNYATVSLGSDDVGFESNVTVEDVNGDGEVSFLFNTYEVTGANSVPEDGGDIYEIVETEDDDNDDITNATIDQGVDSLLESGEYDLEVRAGQDETEDSQNVATLVLEERNTTAINSWTAPDGTSFDDLAELQDAVANNNLTQTDRVADGDLAVHQIEASGLEGVLNAQNDEDVTTAFFNAEDDPSAADRYAHPFDLTIEEADPGANQDPYEVELGSNNATVWADGENDTYYLIYDTNGNSLNAASDIEDGDTLNANFTVLEDEDNFTAVEDGETVEDEYDIVEAEYTVDEPVNVSASGSQTISGETTVAPGTELSLRVRSSGDTQPSFLKTSNVYVTENRTFSGTFDFSEQEVGDTFTLTVSGSPAGSEEYDGNVVESVQTDTSMTTTGPSDTTTEPSDTTTEPSDTTTEPSDTTTEPSDTTEAPSTGTGGGEGGSGTQTPGFGVVVALTALLAAALLAIRRD